MMNRCVWKKALKGVLAVVLLCSVMTFPALGASDLADARQLVEKSRMTFENFLAAPEMDAFRSLLKDAKGVFIAPQILKGAFIVGASGGSGVLAVRDARTGHWVGPAFYTIGEVSFGLQAGGQASEVVLLAMTERGVTAFLNSSVKLGADVGIAAGPIGAGTAAATANLSADILSFSRSQGLFAGISLDGAVVKVRNGWNRAYYRNSKVSPTDILIRTTAKNPRAEDFLLEVSRAAGKK